IVAEHFGHCEYFVVYEVENKEIKGSEIIKNPPHQKGALPKFLKGHEINVLVTGNMGKMAVNLCNELGIECYRGAEGDPVEVINSYLAGTLVSDDSECNHDKENH
ncbi:MAG: NifB/NifX family molybdenum-iron cluster-binding protein, partial [Sphaerochaetaceae bacterium]|nr:NifB/NifX family molybdenum-iron cluster-binding protein [Sphaerochaetaceae bacterium]